jgi:hypothetical protein
MPIHLAAAPNEKDESLRSAAAKAIRKIEQK